MPNRLPFKLPEWAPRVTWVSEEARVVWEPRISQVSQSWIETERDLVAAGVRPSALQHVSPEQLPELMQREALRGLIVLPLAQVAKTQSYQSASVSLAAGAPFDYRCAITHPEHAAGWANAWSQGNNDEIGRLLGYPDCCRRFFEQAWVKERWMDTTWPMAQAEGHTADIHNNGGVVNLLWRWHGVRSVSHLPCSFRCLASRQMQDDAFTVMRQKFPNEQQWLEEILSWPVEWTALHGIAEIRTPIHRTSVATDATAEKLTVNYHGNGYPAEGAQGLKFPHRKVKPVSLMRLSNSKDNGFASHAAMQEAHSKLLSLLTPPYKTVLDLGCGDGVLLSKIPATRRVGVETDQRVAKLAEGRVDRVIVGDVTNRAFVDKVIAEEKPDLVLAQRNRNPVETVNAPLVLSYTYDGQVDAHLWALPNGRNLGAKS